MDAVRSVLKNPGFLVVCALVVMTPMFRGAVHLWAETLIQMLVLTGVLFVVLGKLLSRDQSEAIPGRGNPGPRGEKKAFKGWGKFGNCRSFHALARFKKN